MITTIYMCDVCQRKETEEWVGESVPPRRLKRINVWDVCRKCEDDIMLIRPTTRARLEMRALEPFDTEDRGA